ncbi:MAG: isoprenylcysteine carboxylmethyltransferase family protein [Candidatus Heimdallarchaeota archaeon]|nr:MAG: isoprenylcysteine carboxylmethyltransferase family protein [Candidatus Heimdallarchaeota archaeon]
MRQVIRKTIRKLIHFLVFYPLYYLIWFSLVGRDLLNDAFIVFIIFFYFGISLIDVILRPMSDPNELKDRYMIILLLFFLIGPLILILAYYENKFIVSEFLPIYDTDLFRYLGITLMVIGSVIMLSSRYQLNKHSYGGGSLSEEKEQNLITDGIYKSIRHPMYSGGLVLTIGMELAFRSLIMLSIHTLIFFVIFRNRMIREEEVLLTKFGERYQEYLKKTYRLIPYLY